MRRGVQAQEVPEPRRFYSVAEVARMTGTSQMTLYRAIHAGEFPAVRIRGRLIVPAKALEELVDVAIDTRAAVAAVGGAGMGPE